MITVIQQGHFTTVQDEGRWGYQAYGLPIAGAMDKYACRVANLLAGNSSEAAVLEMTATGAAFKFDAEQLVAVGGADMQGTLNGAPLANWSSFIVPAGGELRFDTAVSGYRTYIAVRGGIDVPKVLESRSTCTRARIGGYEGRSLRQGDVLAVGQDAALDTKPQTLAARYIPYYPRDIILRLVLGPQETMFSPKAISSFFNNSYAVTDRLDRTSYQLKGPKMNTLGKADIVSDAMCMGFVQIPSHGMPVIMMADHQTTGGFAKIGAVIHADLPKLAQAGPGDSIHFCGVAEKEAIIALRSERQRYQHIAKAVQLQKK